jgi:Fuc2NAc and GlcNAc transferase
MNPISVSFLPTTLAFICGVSGAALTVLYGHRWGMLDVPVSRSSHERPVPKGGGIGILCGFTGNALLLQFPWTFWFPVTMVSLLSFGGDRYDIPPILRLCIQFGGSLIFLVGMNDVYGPGWLTGAIASDTMLFSMFLKGTLVLTMAVFIVGTANFYNFMDGINGIAGITGVVAFVLLSFQTSVAARQTLCLAIASSCLGFLPFNFPRARVFMGDVGSVLLGFVYAGMVLLISENSLDLVCMAAFLFPFYADELITMGIRIRNGENLTRPHRRHLYQILVNEFGFAHWSVSTGYAMLQTMISISVLMMKNRGIAAVMTLLLCFFLCFCTVSFLIRCKLRSADNAIQKNT